MLKWSGNYIKETHLPEPRRRLVLVHKGMGENKHRMHCNCAMELGEQKCWRLYIAINDYLKRMQSLLYK